MAPVASVVIGGLMVDSEPGPGASPVFGWRRASRTPRNVVPAIPPVSHDPGAQRDPPIGAQPPTEQLQACPWLYVHADPDARAAFVTDDHRCEIRPDEVPGPGHQLAYCLTPNHVSCPQLRSYEAQRHAAAQERSARQSPLAPAAATGRSSARRLPTPHFDRVQRPVPGPERSWVASKLLWTTGGVVATLALVAGLAVVASPGVLSSEPEVEATAQTAASPSLADPGAADATVVIEGGTLAADSAPSPQQAPERLTPLTYTVQPGDTLGKIARDLGISVGDLIDANDITAETVVIVGDQLRVPAPLAGPPPAD